MRQRKVKTQKQLAEQLQAVCDMYRVCELVLTLGDAHHLITAIAGEFNKARKYDDSILLSFILTDEKHPSVNFEGVKVERCHILIDVELTPDPGESQSFDFEDSQAKLDGLYNRIKDIME